MLDRIDNRRGSSNLNNTILNEGWPAPIRRTLALGQVVFCAAETSPLQDQPAPTTVPQLSLADRRRLQSELINQLTNLDNNAVIAILPAEARQAQTNSLRNRIREQVDALIRSIRNNPNTANDAIPLPPGLEDRDRLSIDQITEIRNHINNNQQAALNTLRDQIVQTRLEQQLPAVLRTLLRDRLTAETDSGNFGPLSRAVYNRVCTWLRQAIIDTLQTLDDRTMAFPPGCPVEPPRSPISNRHVSDELFRAMLRRMRPGEPGTDINFQLPTLGNDASPSTQQFNQLWRALTWFRDANELLSPIREESQRQVISTLITRFNRPGWARENYPDVQQWQARAQAMINLESEIRACAELIVNLHNRFNTFPLDGVQGGNPPFPGQIRIENGRITSIAPDLPERLDLLDENLNTENRRRIERCLQWLEHHGLRVNRQLARIFGNGANIYMLGDHAAGDFSPADLTALRNRLPENVRNQFNLITHDFEVVRGPNNTYRVTPITRYRNSPWYNYLNRLVDGTVHTERGATETLQAGELVLVNRSGRFELLAVENLASWKSSHTTWTNVRDGVTAAVDLSMIVLGGVEARAAWVAAGQLAARSGMGVARSYLARTLALRGGAWHMALGGTGFLTSAYWRDPAVSFLGISGSNLEHGRRYIMLADGGLQLATGRGIGSLGTSRTLADQTQRVIAESFWLRNFERIGHLDFLHYTPIPYVRLSPSAAAAMRFSQARIGFAHLSTGQYALPTLQVGMSFANVVGMVRDGRPPTGNALDPAGLTDRLPQTPFLARYAEQLLTNANVDRTQITRLLGFITDNRPRQQAPERRLDVEQQLINQFNRNGATERERLAIGTVLLLEAARNTANGAIPSDLGQGNTGLASRTVREFLSSRFRESQDPEIRLLAAQGLMAIHDITAQEFAAFCKAMATNNNLPKEARAQAIIGLALCMTMAGIAEGELASRIQNGRAGVEENARYLIDSFGVTHRDLQACLESIARQNGGDRDLRALAAASANTTRLANFGQSMSELQRLATAWHAARNRPAGSFATAQVGIWAQELSLPVRFSQPDPSRTAQHTRRIFNAVRALNMLSDQSFSPIWQAHNTALAANALTGGPDAGLPGLLQTGSTPTRGRALSRQALNDALIACVNAADPEIALQALKQLASNVSTLQAQQLNTLRDPNSIRLLLSRLALPNQGYQGDYNSAAAIDALTGLFGRPSIGMIGVDAALTARSVEEQLIRTQCRVEVIRLLPEFFRTAPDNVRNMIMAQLTATLVPPEGADQRTNTPELRQAAAITLGRILEGRPAARSYLGNNLPVAADTIQSLLRQPSPLATISLDQNLLQSDRSPLARLEVALQDSSPLVRLAAIEALLLVRPARLSHGRTLQQLCADLLVTESDPAVLAALRRAEFLERAPDPTSPDYVDEFQQARRDLLLSLNVRGDRSLAGMPAFIFERCATVRGGPGDRDYGGPFGRSHHSIDAPALRRLVTGNGPHAENALKALVYIIVSNGRPFELGMDQWAASMQAVGILWAHAGAINPANQPGKARDALWALELCMVMAPNLHPMDRICLLQEYISLVDAMPADPALRHRAGVVLAIVLQREFVSGATNQATTNLQRDCLRYLGTHRTRAALPILELIVRTNRAGPVLNAARTLLQEFSNDPAINAAATRGGPHRGTVAFDDAYEHLQRQLIDMNRGLFTPPQIILHAPGIGINQPRMLEIVSVPGNTPERRALLRNFANGDWFLEPANIALAPNLQYMRWNGHQLPVRRGARRDPQAGFNSLVALAERDTSDAPTQAARDAERRIQREARLALAWIVAVNGEGLAHFLRDDFVRGASEALVRISGRQLQGLAELDSVIESALVAQPLLDRRVRNNLITILWNRRQSNGGSIADSQVALILAGALRSEFQTMPRPNEPHFAISRDMQVRILGYLQEIGHRMCAPVVEALSAHHPVPEVRNRATQTLIALHDNVIRVWDRARQPAAIDHTTLPAARAQALRQALQGNGAHDGVVQAMFNAYLGRPILANDPRHDLYVESLSDRRAHVKLAAALVILRTENTGFTQQERQAAMAVAADAALHGIHIGLKNSGRQILLDNLALGRNLLHPVAGTTIEIVRTADNVNLIESVNGRTNAALINGAFRTPQDGIAPPLLQSILTTRALDPETRLAAARSWFTSNHNDMTPETYNTFLVLLVDMANSTDVATRNAAIQIMSNALTSEREQMTSVGQHNRGQRQLLLVRALALIAHPLAREAIRTTALEHPHFLVRREASRAYSNFSLSTLNTSLDRALTNDTVVSFNPITDERDWRRHWLTDNPALGLARISQLYALVDRRSTAISLSTKGLAIDALIPLLIDGNGEAFRRGHWIFRTLDPNLARLAIFALNQRLSQELNALQAGRSPTWQERLKIERCLDLILAVCRSSPLNQESLARLQTTLLSVRTNSHFAESSQIGQIVERMLASATGPIIATNDARLDWLNNPHTALQFAAARDCLLPSSTVSRHNRKRAIEVLSDLFIHGNSQMRTQAETMLSGLTGVDANTALDALATVALGLTGQNQQEQRLRCWTFSEQLCESAHLPSESERFLRARLERRRADGSADAQELHALQMRLFDVIAQNSYNPEILYSSTAVERYSVALLVAEQAHGLDSLEVARLELALAKAACSRSFTHENAASRRHASDVALRCARHAYQVMTLRLGPDAPETCDALYRLGIAEVNQNMLADGIEHLNEALRAYRRNPTQFGLGTEAWICSQLAQAYIRNGDFNNADRISHQLRKMATGRVAIEHRLELHAALSNLAESYIRFPRPPRYSSAETVWRTAFDLSRSSWGESNPRTLESMLMLAQSLAGQKGNVQAATDLMNRAMTLFAQESDMFVLDRARIHRAHSRVLATLGRLREAVEASTRSRDLTPTVPAR